VEPRKDSVGVQLFWTGHQERIKGKCIRQAAPEEWMDYWYMATSFLEWDECEAAHCPEINYSIWMIIDDAVFSNPSTPLLREMCMISALLSTHSWHTRW
jgi:hypothetical protein